jgi:hypothetical protein
MTDLRESRVTASLGLQCPSSGNPLPASTLLTESFADSPIQPQLRHIQERCCKLKLANTQMRPASILGGPHSSQFAGTTATPCVVGFLENDGGNRFCNGSVFVNSENVEDIPRVCATVGSGGPQTPHSEDRAALVGAGTMMAPPRNRKIPD